MRIIPEKKEEKGHENFTGDLQRYPRQRSVEKGLCRCREGRADFLKVNGCEATAEEIKAFLREKADQPLSEEELDSVAGGACGPSYGQTMEAGLSIATFGIGCATLAIYSAASGHTGQEQEDENLICNPDE